MAPKCKSTFCNAFIPFWKWSGLFQRSTAAILFLTNCPASQAAEIAGCKWCSRLQSVPVVVVWGKRKSRAHWGSWGAPGVRLGWFQSLSWSLLTPSLSLWFPLRTGAQHRQVSRSSVFSRMGGSKQKTEPSKVSLGSKILNISLMYQQDIAGKT